MKNLNLKNEIWLQKYIEDNKNDLIYIEQYYIKWYKVITEIISKELGIEIYKDKDLVIDISIDTLENIIHKNLVFSSYNRANYSISVINNLLKILNVKAEILPSKLKNKIERDVLYTKDEVEEICDMIGNRQHAFIVYATFMGFSIDRTYPMRHLKSEILKEKKKVITMDYEEYHREFFVDKYFYQLADECNKLTDTGGGMFIGLPYNMNSEYILKSRMMTTSNNGLNPVSRYLPSNAIDEVDEKYFGGSKIITRRKLHNSGIMYLMNEIQKIRSIKWNVYTLTIYKGIFNKVFAIIDMAKQYESLYKNKENSNMPLIDPTAGLKGIFVGNYN